MHASSRQVIASALAGALLVLLLHAFGGSLVHAMRAEVDTGACRRWSGPAAYCF